MDETLQKTQRRVVGEINHASSLLSCVPASIRELASHAAKIGMIANPVENQT